MEEVNQGEVVFLQLACVVVEVGALVCAPFLWRLLLFIVEQGSMSGMVIANILGITTKSPAACSSLYMSNGALKLSRLMQLSSCVERLALPRWSAAARPRNLDFAKLLIKR